jgi:hypothetical protein
LGFNLIPCNFFVINTHYIPRAKDIPPSLLAFYSNNARAIFSRVDLRLAQKEKERTKGLSNAVDHLNQSTDRSGCLSDCSSLARGATRGADETVICDGLGFLGGVGKVECPDSQDTDYYEDKGLDVVWSGLGG